MQGGKHELNLNQNYNNPKLKLNNIITKQIKINY